jgi:hypothetical protein
MGFFKIAGHGEECYRAFFSWEKFQMLLLLLLSKKVVP